MMRANLFKLIHSPMFYLSPLAVLAISLYNAFYGIHTFSNLLLKIDYLISFEFYRKLFILFAALPFSSNFADEWNSKVITNCISRRNVRVYAVSNITICFLSAFAVVFAGMMIYVFVQSAQMPLYDENSFFPPYGELIKNGAPMLAITAIVFVYALSCAMWAVMGLAATAFFPSRYIAVCAPFVFSYMFERFSKIVPGEFQLGPLSQSWSGWEPLPAFAKSVAVILSITAVCGAIFTIKVKRRIENELP